MQHTALGRTLRSTYIGSGPAPLFPDGVVRAGDVYVRSTDYQRSVLSAGAMVSCNPPRCLVVQCLCNRRGWGRGEIRLPACFSLRSMPCLFTFDHGVRTTCCSRHRALLPSTAPWVTHCTVPTTYPPTITHVGNVNLCADLPAKHPAAAVGATQSPASPPNPAVEAGPGAVRSDGCQNGDRTRHGAAASTDWRHCVHASVCWS